MKNESTMQHPLALWVLKAMLLILGICALGPGIMLLSDPSGRLVAFPEGALDHSPFTDYFIPGLLLTLCMGLLPLLAWYALWRKPQFDFLQDINPFPARHWSWTVALLSGLTLLIWIVVQMLMVPYLFLQPLFLAWGAGIIALCFTPGIRAWYAQPFGDESRKLVL